MYFFREFFKILLHTLNTESLCVEHAAGLPQKGEYTLRNQIHNVLQLTEDTQTTLLQAEQWEPKSSGCGSGLNGSRAMKASSSSLNWQQQPTIRTSMLQPYLTGSILTLEICRMSMCVQKHEME